jgi:Cytochrome P460
MRTGRRIVSIGSSRARSPICWLSMAAALLLGGESLAAVACPDERPVPQIPTDLELCRRLEPIVRRPAALPLSDYQAKLAEFLNGFCHRDEQSGWKVDKRLRDTGPWIASPRDGKWSGQYFGTHAPVLVWYSPDFYQWLKVNRADADQTQEAPVPDGAILVKEMYSPPAATCAGIDPLRLLPLANGAAIMVRDSKASYDGWFWGWYGWDGSGWSVDWPAKSTSPYPSMGFGQYCTNCHASAKDNHTFATLRNIKGEAGTPLVYLSQTFILDPQWQGQNAGEIAQQGLLPDSTSQNLHLRVLKSSGFAAQTRASYDPAFTRTFAIRGGPPRRQEIVVMPPETYDNVWVGSGQPTIKSQFVTSDQCLGCHSAGGAGLQFDMTEPGPRGKLVNVSPYGTWRGSPMGLSGRDPIFFAQLASEVETFHRESSASIEDTCLSCHGVMGQRQRAIDTSEEGRACAPFDRATVHATPFPPGDPIAALAAYGALARDGVSCAACHRAVLGKGDTEKYRNAAQNRCIEPRQAAANPGFTGFARTFTGNFLVGPPDQLFGPYDAPKHKPMKSAIGSTPVHDRNISSSEMCGSCHTVHLPVLQGGRAIAHTFEQTTYPEWAFSGYRTGRTPDGALPQGAGARAQSCQDCHMPSRNPDGSPYRSKIASIQEYSNFPQVEHTLPPQDIDLPVRSPFSKHTLVGLNVFLLKMAWQFPDLLGIRSGDPMLSDAGIDPILTAEGAMLEQAANRTATIAVGDVRLDNRNLEARVTVSSQVGHKFPSGVSFRRAFLELNVFDANKKRLWSSGRTNDIGVIVDEKEAPIAGELWWQPDCSARIEPGARRHQPHFQVITRQDQAQIYQELVAAPGEGPGAYCGSHARPEGPLTTSFLSQCATVKDNRMLPHGTLGLDERKEIAAALGAGADLAEHTEPVGVGDDPDYRAGGGDSIVYRVPRAGLGGVPASVEATLYYQATPPFYLQDRFCTSDSSDTKRLYLLAGQLNLFGSPARSWKLKLVTSGQVRVP